MGATRLPSSNARMKTVDVLGFSIGGFVAQEISLQGPELVRKLVLWAPGRAAAKAWHADTRSAANFWRHLCRPDDIWLSVHFTPWRRARPQAVNSSSVSGCATKTAIRSQRESRASPDRGHRQVGRQRDAPTVPADNQAPALVVNGSSDVIIYPINSFILQQNIPNRSYLYPDPSRLALSVSRAVRAPPSMFLDS